MMKSQPPTDDLYLAAVKLADERASVAREVLGIIVVNAKTMMPVADAAGLTQYEFCQPDHRLIFLAAVIAQEHDTPTVFSLARSALRHYRLWLPDLPRGSRGMRWSDAMLAELFNEQPPNTGALRASIHRLNRIVRRQDRARFHVNRAAALLVNDDALADEHVNEGRAAA